MVNDRKNEKKRRAAVKTNAPPEKLFVFADSRDVSYCFLSCAIFYDATGDVFLPSRLIGLLFFFLFGVRNKNNPQLV